MNSKKEHGQKVKGERRKSEATGDMVMGVLIIKRVIA